MAKEKISITIDKSLSEEIQNYAVKKKLSKSQLIENIIFQWQKDQKSKQMIEGYKAMAKENLEIAKDFESSGNEIWLNG